MGTIESQNARIRKHLESGRSLTSLDALYQFGTLRLSGRIYDLKKQGLNIKSESIEITSPSVYTGTKRVTKYSIIR
jgi:hypothetical protein